MAYTVDPGEYTLAPIDGVDPIYAETMMRQAMANRYQRAVPELTNEEAHAAAEATWFTEWDDHPAPRTMESAFTQVDADLSYWGEE